MKLIFAMKIYNYDVYGLDDREEYHFILFDYLDGKYKYLTLRASETGNRWRQRKDLWI